jgi:hypothetical protein
MGEVRPTIGSVTIVSLWAALTERGCSASEESGASRCRHFRNRLITVAVPFRQILLNSAPHWCSPIGSHGAIGPTPNATRWVQPITLLTV